MNKRSYLWNTTASMLNSVMSAILLFVVIRVLGVEAGGIFTLGYSVAQLMLTIGYYDMRAFQATDVTDAFSFGDYFNSRVITCLVMMAISAIYIITKNYSGEKLIIVALLCVFKMTDAIEDVYHGQMQKREHLDVAGMIQTTRLTVCIILFTIGLLLTGGLLITCIVVTVFSLVASILPNIIILKRYEKYSLAFNPGKVFGLLRTCLPLCVGSYLALYIGNAPKYAIDSFMGNAAQSYYNIIFMPSYVINLLSGFILRPTLTTLASDWEEGKVSSFVGRIRKLIIIILVLTVAGMAAAYILGPEVLGFVYGVDLLEHRMALLVLILGGGFYAFGIVIYYGITIARQQKYMTIVYALVALATFFCAPLLVSSIGIMGAALAYCLSTVFRFIGFTVIFVVVLRKEKKVGD
ncbi:MAG: lipopolysaccharide biosynthesis protein [Lachnospiraceae bacterium]|nr:lipopolysaccharide biosynthesis protein [Lachnospiraceae bacterium]